MVNLRASGVIYPLQTFSDGRKGISGRLLKLDLRILKQALL
jgi:hypothetical protein